MELNQLPNLIDDEYKITINDMGTAPVIAAMAEVLRIPQAINKFLGTTDPRKKVDIGTSVEALIINILYGRTPLVHVAESFKHLDCEVLFGKGITASDFSDDCLGKDLEELGSNDCRELYSQICMYALELHDCMANAVHVDTSNISVYGEYANSPAENFEITYGDPKSKRKDLKQLNIGMFVQQNGFPVGGNALSGNSSDAIWFRDALDELNNIFTGDLYTMPVCIFDAAGSNKDMFKKANKLVVPTIIRMSDRFNTVGEHVDKAWDEGQWCIIDKKGQTFKEPPAGNFYKMRSFDISIDDRDWRLVVVYSSALEKEKQATAKRNFPKYKEKLEKGIVKLSKISFNTAGEALSAGKEFIDKNIGLKVPFKYEMSVEEKEISKYKKRGKPGKTSEKTTSIEYHVKIVIGERDDDLYAEWLKQESCFVLVSNVPKDRLTTEEVFLEYKEQWVIEDKFKFLKQPVVLGPIWLQKQERIKGLVFVLLLSVLVSMYICYRCMISLQGKTNAPKNTGKSSDTKTGTEIKEGAAAGSNIDISEDKTKTITDNGTVPNAESKHAMSINQKLLTSDGRLVERPTYKVIKKLLDPIKTIIKIDSRGNAIRKFPYGTEMRLLDLVTKIGFDPIIYLEKFTLKMDLWEYN